MPTENENRWPSYDQGDTGEREYSMLDYMVALVVVFIVVLGCNCFAMLWCYNWWTSKNYPVPL